ncbi:MAG: hypothetical protein GXP19_05445 [Gammaproteobacteria bacterium]|nr:hypothetical protein [Gammaproteobacteria bacterium]
MMIKILEDYETRALLLSPLMAGPALLLTKFQLEYYLAGDWWLLLIPPLYSTFLAAPFSYAGTLIFGLPFYLILRAFRLDSFWVLALSGLPLGLIVSVMFSGFDADYALVITTCGCMVSTTAAIIIFIGKKNHLKNTN